MFSQIEQKLRELVRVWWRPITCIGIAGGVIVNAIALPLINSEPISLTDLAATIASCATIFAVREWGKINGAE